MNRSIFKSVGTLSLAVVLGTAGTIWLLKNDADDGDANSQSSGKASTSEQSATARKPLSPYQRRAADILKLASVDQQKLELKILGEEWARADSQEAFAFRESLLRRPILRQPFDLGAMPVLAETEPEFVLQQIGAGVWWQDQRLQERDALMVLTKTRAGWVAEQIQAGVKGFSPSEPVVREVARNLATEDPRLSLKFANSLEKASTRSSALAGTVGAWGRNDPHAASEWLAGQERGEDHDKIVISFVNAVVDKVAGDAFQWAISIEDEAARLQACKKAVRLHSEQEGEAPARSMIQVSSLAASEKAQLLDVLEAGPMVPAQAKGL